MQIVKLIRKLIILVQVIKQLITYFKQNQICNRYYITSELNDVLESGFYEFFQGYDRLDSFVHEVMKVENKKSFYFKNTNEDILLNEDEKYF